MAPKLEQNIVDNQSVQTCHMLWVSLGGGGGEGGGSLQKSYLRQLYGSRIWGFSCVFLRRRFTGERGDCLRQGTYCKRCGCRERRYFGRDRVPHVIVCDVSAAITLLRGRKKRFVFAAWKGGFATKLRPRASYTRLRRCRRFMTCAHRWRGIPVGHPPPSRGYLLAG